MKNKINIKILILSIIFSLLTIIGESYKKINSINYISNHIFRSISLFVIYTILIYLFIYVICKLFKKISIKKDSKVLEYIFDKHIILVPIFILLCWLPFIIIKYPGSPGWDFYYMMRETYIRVVTRHFPFLYIYFCRLFTDFGIRINNVEMGLFLLTLVHTFTMLYSFFLCFKYMRKWNINYKYRLFVLLFFGLNPLFLNYSNTIYHDVLYSSFMLIYMLLLTDILIVKKIDIKLLIKISIISLLIIITRKNGIYVIIPISIILLIKYIKGIKKKIILILPIILYFLVQISISIYQFETSKSYLSTSWGEILSIPIQNISRYSRDYHKDITNKEKQELDEVLEYDKAGISYYPKNADDVKNSAFIYNPNFDELVNFLKIWFKLFIRHPGCYIESFINNTYQLYYPFENTTYLFTYVLDNIKDKDIELGFKLEENSYERKNIINSFNTSIENIPFIKYIDDPGIYCWLFIILLFFLRKKKNILPLIPNIMTFIITLVGPTIDYNSRYAFPIIFSIFVLYAFYSTNLIKDEGKNKSKSYNINRR